MEKVSRVSFDGEVLAGWWYLDLEGKPVERNPLSHPYNFDTFVQWRKPEWKGGPTKGSVWSDRLYQWDGPKYYACTRAVWGNCGQSFDEPRTPEEIERFLRLYNDEPELELVAVLKACNQSSGYPLWCLLYN